MRNCAHSLVMTVPVVIAFVICGTGVAAAALGFQVRYSRSYCGTPATSNQNTSDAELASQYPLSSIQAQAGPTINTITSFYAGNQRQGPTHGSQPYGQSIGLYSPDNITFDKIVAVTACCAGATHANMGVTHLLFVSASGTVLALGAGDYCRMQQFEPVPTGYTLGGLVTEAVSGRSPVRWVAFVFVEKGVLNTREPPLPPRPPPQPRSLPSPVVASPSAVKSSSAGSDGSTSSGVHRVVMIVMLIVGAALPAVVIGVLLWRRAMRLRQAAGQPSNAFSGGGPPVPAYPVAGGGGGGPAVGLAAMGRQAPYLAAPEWGRPGGQRPPAQGDIAVGVPVVPLNYAVVGDSSTATGGVADRCSGDGGISAAVAAAAAAGVAVAVAVADGTVAPATAGGINMMGGCASISNHQRGSSSGADGVKKTSEGAADAGTAEATAPAPHPGPDGEAAAGGDPTSGERRAPQASPPELQPRPGA